ncbi:hypothetical protein [Leucobacter massiliensis]|uniref:Uncharacterized protein n=1 Tax=Leucobacter massiliensis TaxID=1686285 RepID=A0A2S9QKY0_9MICO|nr:hypothetical protein [Leucobacter massiliensis]PRI10247.1 hypothetical protein B4915_12660 [Leucobacter massiliensis]
MNTTVTPLHPQYPVRPLRTPYHSLGDGSEMVVPSWAQHRSVYRSSGRTLYLVDTERLSDAHGDLARLDRAGWEVRVAEDPEAPGSRARIALSRRELAQAA